MAKKKAKKTATTAESAEALQPSRLMAVQIEVIKREVFKDINQLFGDQINRGINQAVQSCYRLHAETRASVIDATNTKIQIAEQGLKNTCASKSEVRWVIDVCMGVQNQINKMLETWKNGGFDTINDRLVDLAAGLQTFKKERDGTDPSHVARLEDIEQDIQNLVYEVRTLKAKHLQFIKDKVHHGQGSPQTKQRQGRERPIRQGSQAGAGRRSPRVRPKAVRVQGQTG